MYIRTQRALAVGVSGWGYLRCDYKDVLGETIYCAEIGNDFTGEFENQEQRMEYLNIIASKILEKIGK